MVAFIQKQAEIVKLLSRLYENGLIREDSAGAKLFTLGGMDRKLREALYTAALQIAAIRGDNPGFTWMLMPYSDSNIEKVMGYLSHVLQQTSAVSLGRDDSVAAACEAPGTHFREMVMRQAMGQKPGVPTIPRP